MSSIIVKRGGVDQKFDERKVYASVFASLVAVSTPTKEAELVATEITKIINRWLAEKSHVTSHEIRVQVAHELKDYNHLASYIYDKHRILS